MAPLESVIEEAGKMQKRTSTSHPLREYGDKNIWVPMHSMQTPILH